MEIKNCSACGTPTMASEMHACSACGAEMCSACVSNNAGMCSNCSSQLTNG